MRAWVVFESMFGNGARIAEAIADGVRDTMPVEIHEVGAAPRVLEPTVGLLAVGGPTHRFGLSRPDSRRAAAQEVDVPLVSASIGIREWLGGLQGVADGTAAAAFGTVIEEPRWVRRLGRADRAIARRLRALGFATVVPPESFWVTGMTGPLAEGEEERARAWGAELGRAAQARTADAADD